MDITPAIYLDENGRCEDLYPANGTDFKLKEVQDRVKGFVEVVVLEEGKSIMLVNDDYLAQFPKINIEATIVAQAYSAIPPGEYIKGPVIICADDMFR